MTAPETPTYLAPVQRRIAELEADLATATDTLEQRSDALNRTGASNDQLRATLAKADKWVDLLVEAVEGECKTTSGTCHGFDLAPTGCALVADLNHLRAILADQEPASE